MVDVYTYARLALNLLAESALPRGVRLKVEIDPDIHEVAIRAFWMDTSDQMRTALVRWTDSNRCSVAEAVSALRADVGRQLAEHGLPRSC